MSYSFSGLTVRSGFWYFLQVACADGFDFHHCYLSLLRKKMFIPLESR